MVEFTTLCHCTDPVLAEKIRAQLEAEGLRARVVGAERDTMLGGAGAFVGLQIVVPEDELEEAEAILEELEGPWSEDDEGQTAVRVSVPPQFAEEEEEDDDGDEDGDEDEDMPDRLTPMMRYVAWRFSWPVLALVGAVLIVRGAYAKAAFSLMFAALAFGLTRSGTDEDADDDDE